MKFTELNTAIYRRQKLSPFSVESDIPLEQYFENWDIQIISV